MDGVLIIDKPTGPTSFDVVRQVRTLLKVKKAGHTGTLDPMATGVLPICLGEATKVAGFLTEGDKAYDATVRLGVETDTQDAEGKVLAERPVPQLNAAVLEAALAPFRGTFAQMPPMYSAVKVDGKAPLRAGPRRRGGGARQPPGDGVRADAARLQRHHASALRALLQGLLRAHARL